MNAAQERALRAAAGNARDDLARARMQKKADPNWRSGNGETIDEVIAGYEARVADLTEGLTP